MRLAYSLLSITMLFLVGGAAYIIDGRRNNPPHVITIDTPMLTIESPAFTHNSLIPAEYTCDGVNHSPELQMSNVPEDTQSLVLFVDDPDIPQFVKDRMGIDVFDHWVLFNIPATTTVIGVGETPAGAVVGNNSSSEAAYTGPCPPDGEHRYFFKLYALSSVLELKEGATKAEVWKAMQGKIIEAAGLVGRYQRK